MIRPSFTPNTDICGFGGNSKLYAPFYKTGTSYYRGPFVDSIDLGAGKASEVGIHIGDDGVTGYVQKSTGEVEQVKLEAFNIKSGYKSWSEE